jgi:diguanylate cyclase (GGDEF)-like protein/PAS domain S-box-containing protein
MEISLGTSEQHYRALYETAPLALIEFDRDNKVLAWNHAAELIFGWPKLDMLGQSLERMVPAAELAYVQKVMAQSWQGDIVRGVNRNLTRDGKTILCRWSNVAQKDGNGDTIAVLSLAEDITENQRMHDELESANASLRVQIQQVESLQENLRQQALRDPLTNLYNRRFFHANLDRELAQSERDGKTLCLAMIDIDWFKQINDTAGHQVGDQVLKLLALLLDSNTRAGDIVCRYGGEEFVIVMPDIDAANGMARVESWRRAFAGLGVHAEAGEIHATFSAGIALWPQHASNGDRLLRRADQALYTAKQTGRNRTVLAG